MVRWSDELIGRAPPHQPSTAGPLAVGSSPPSTASLPAAAPGAPVRILGQRPAYRGPPGGDARAARRCRSPTAAAPLRVLAIGDSIGLSFGQPSPPSSTRPGWRTTTVDGREGTGLARPDSFDWSAEVEADLAQFHPQVVVAMFGGNDDQDVIVNSRFIAFGSTQLAADLRRSGARRSPPRSTPPVPGSSGRACR